MLRDVRNLTRLAGIVWTLARHDALFPLANLHLPAYAGVLLRLFARVARRRSALRRGERLALALRELGPSFIKLGQTLSTRADLVGEAVATDLAALQDQLPPFPTAAAKATIVAELGRPLGELFAAFDDTPVAAASISQVHFAVARDFDEDGTEILTDVAVKVLRPGIERAFARDLELFLWTAEWLERVQPSFRRLKPIEVVNTFARVVATEMDLRMEAAAASEIGENFIDDPTFRIPVVDWRRTGQRVLALERIAGIPIDEREMLIEAGLELNDVLAKAACAFFNQVFRDGFFHADLHPGNLSVGADGAIQAVDFGIMGRLDLQTRRYLGEMLIGFLDGDYRRVADVHFRAGYVPADQPFDDFMQACRAIGEPILGLPLNEISIGRLLGQLFQVTERFQMETQPQLLLLQKTMVVAEGVGRILNANVNMWQLARPLIEEWVIANLGPQAKVQEGLWAVIDGLERLPRTLANLEKAAALAAADHEAHMYTGTATAEPRGLPRNGHEPRRTLRRNWRTADPGAARSIARALWAIAALLALWLLSGN